MGPAAARALLALAPTALLAACAGGGYAPRPLTPHAFTQDFAARRLDTPALRDFLPRCGLHAAPWPRARWDAATLECAALYFNPALAQARADAEVVRARTRTAAQRANPTLKLDAQHHDRTDGGVSPWSAGPALEIPIAAPGRRAARMERADAEARAAAMAYEVQAQDVRRTLREDLAAYAAAGHRARLLDGKVATLEALHALVARRADLGYAARVEAIRVQTELQAAQLARAEASAGRTATLNALAADVGVPAAALAAVTLDTTPYALPPPAQAAAPAALQDRALADRAEMRLALARYAASEAALKEQIAARNPDFTLAPGYFFDQGDHIWSLAAAFVLPLFNRNEGPIGEAQAQREASARSAQVVQARIIGEVRTAHDDDATARATAAEARSLAQRQAALAAAEQQRFAAGETDRPSLLREQLASGDAELAAAARTGAAWQARIRLQAALGDRLAPPSPTAPDAPDTTP